MTWFPGEASLIRLWDTVEKLGTGLLSPTQIKREGKARADVRRLEILAEERARREIDEIAAGRLTFDNAGHLIAVNHERPALAAPNSPSECVSNTTQAKPNAALVTAETQELLFRARIARGREDLRRLANLRGTVRIAEEAVEAGSEVLEETPESISEDWLSSWREGAERVSESELQQLWAHILKSETSAPGSMSVRTLVFLRGLDRHDAELISALGPYVVNRSFVFGHFGILANGGLDLERLLALEDMGILASTSTGSAGLAQQITLSKEKPFLIEFPGGEGLILHSTEQQTVQHRAFPLTRVGCDMMKLGSFKAPEAYVDAVIGQFKSEKVTIERGTIVSKEEGTVRLDNLRTV